VAVEPSEHQPALAGGSHDLPAEVAHAEHPHEQPSDWGWHADFGRPARIAGWLTVIGLVLMTTSTHYNGAGAVWLLLTAALLVVGLAWDIRRRRTAWRD
jgi:hypothetical protein